VESIHRLKTLRLDMPICQCRLAPVLKVLLLSAGLLASLATIRPAFGYSLLTHEQVVDIVWKDHLEPALLKRFANANPEQLRQAHAYAYGGCLVQDLGYYPFGSKFLSDLTHYVRSGDFVLNLIRESTNLNEYAFALGALAHYAGDNTGHPWINHSVALSFPKLRARYGEQVTYEDDPKAHIRTEFGFDVVQVAKNRYTSDQYRQFIGFEVAKPLLERAFLKTYDLKLDDVLGHVDLAIGTFRRAVSELIPELTKAAVIAKRPELVQEIPNFAERKFLFNLSRAQYEEQWGTDYRKPSLFARFLAFLFKLLPKIGPLKTLDIKTPSPETENLYFKSVNQTVEAYRTLLDEVANGHPYFPNLDFDTSNPSQAGEYRLADDTYIELLEKLSHQELNQVPPDLRNNALTFFSSPVSYRRARKDKESWCDALSTLHTLAILARRNGTSEEINGTQVPLR
jgi:hypothetical protein